MLSAAADGVALTVLPVEAYHLGLSSSLSSRPNVMIVIVYSLPFSRLLNVFAAMPVPSSTQAVAEPSLNPM